MAVGMGGGVGRHGLELAALGTARSRKRTFLLKIPHPLASQLRTQFLQGTVYQV